MMADNITESDVKLWIREYFNGKFGDLNDKIDKLPCGDHAEQMGNLRNEMKITRVICYSILLFSGGGTGWQLWKVIAGGG